MDSNDLAKENARLKADIERLEAEKIAIEEELEGLRDLERRIVAVEAEYRRSVNDNDPRMGMFENAAINSHLAHGLMTELKRTKSAEIVEIPEAEGMLLYRISLRVIMPEEEDNDKEEV